ncbi:hypothetical protein [Photobacterium leiognathi]|uniref:hypothetical protein n=1 Tax=Photobacterium leiognathi TaxID=553611 RepID=UPI002981D599|nr:hypothetical protein [Photobacterium leiognathi]
MKNQKGMALMSLLLAMTILSLLLVPAVREWGDKRQRNNATQFAERVLHLAERLQLYNHHRAKTENTNPIYAWPRNLDELMTVYPGAFWQQCTVAEQQTGKCLRPETTPWNVPIKYAQESGPWGRYVELTIPTGSTGDLIKRWSAPLLQQGKYPFTELPNGDVKIRVDYLADAVVYKDFLKRDGSTTLTADWDVGNKNILNVADITLRNADGTMTSVAAGLTRSRFTARHNAVIKHPSCPVGFRPQVQLAVQGNIPQSSINDFKEFGPIQIDGYDVAGGWKITTKYVATRKSDGKKYELTDGVVAGETYCSK